MSQFTFISANEDDIEDLASIFCACWKESYIGVLPEEMRVTMTQTQAKDLWLPSLVTPNGKETMFLVERSDMKRIGMYRIGTDKEDNGHLYALYIHPSYAGQGGGTLAMKEILENFKSRGILRIFLWVFETNSNARKFYERNGFEYTGQQRIQEEFPVLQLQMCKQLI